MFATSEHLEQSSEEHASKSDTEGDTEWNNFQPSDESDGILKKCFSSTALPDRLCSLQSVIKSTS